jgi:hypothetical protein
MQEQEVLTGEQAAVLWPSVYATARNEIPVNTRELVLMAAVARIVEVAAHNIAEQASRLLAQAGVECSITILQGGQDVQS